MSHVVFLTTQVFLTSKVNTVDVFDHVIPHAHHLLVCEAIDVPQGKDKSSSNPVLLPRFIVGREMPLLSIEFCERCIDLVTFWVLVLLKCGRKRMNGYIITLRNLYFHCST